MKLIKQTLLTLVTAVLTIVLVYGGFTIYAASMHKFQDQTLFSGAKMEYHKEMNGFFNKKLKRLTELMDSETGFEEDDYKAPDCKPQDPTKTCLEACGENNTSTYCVSIQSLEIYYLYLKKLQDIGSTPAWYDNMPLNSTLQLTANRNASMQTEFEKSRRVIENTVAAYNEYRTAYPIHKQYVQVIKNLYKYKSKLADIRKEVQKFPGEFIDATSKKCN